MASGALAGAFVAGLIIGMIARGRWGMRRLDPYMPIVMDMDLRTGERSLYKTFRCMISTPS